jgi:Site-specific DNA methylase
MNVLSLFSNIGVAEAYLSEVGVSVVLANELVKRRATLYSRIYPDTKMICGDITTKEIYSAIVNEAKKLQVDTIMATPPCQGISRAGKQYRDDVRNLLILPVIDLIRDINPRYVFIENVPQFVETYISIDGADVLITDYISSELHETYKISINVIDTKYYGVPQTRQRTIILLTRVDIEKQWLMPPADPFLVSLEDAIGDLPSLDPFVKDASNSELLEMFPEYYKKLKASKKVSPWHFPPEHIKRQVITMMHTPTGRTAFDNVKYVPTKADGSTVSGYKSTYRRLRWGDPASTVTMDNRKISSQNNVHPGRYMGLDKNGDVVYSDARALSLYELMKVMSLPESWPLPLDANAAFVRSIIGEGIPPMFVKRVFENII